MMSDFFQPSYWPTNERLKMLTLLLFDVQTRMRGEIGVEFACVLIAILRYPSEEAFQYSRFS